MGFVKILFLLYINIISAAKYDISPDSSMIGILFGLYQITTLLLYGRKRLQVDATIGIIISCVCMCVCATPH